jgi:hypothetical protein
MLPRKLVKWVKNAVPASVAAQFYELFKTFICFMVPVESRLFCIKKEVDFCTVISCCSFSSVYLIRKAI